MVHVTLRDRSTDYHMLVRRCGGKVQRGNTRHGKLDNMNIGRLRCIWYQSNTTVFVMYKYVRTTCFGPF